MQSVWGETLVFLCLPNTAATFGSSRVYIGAGRQRLLGLAAHGDSRPKKINPQGTVYANVRSDW